MKSGSKRGLPGFLYSPGGIGNLFVYSGYAYTFPLKTLRRALAQVAADGKHKERGIETLIGKLQKLKSAETHYCGVGDLSHIRPLIGHIENALTIAGIDVSAELMIARPRTYGAGKIKAAVTAKL